MFSLCSELCRVILLRQLVHMALLAPVICCPDLMYNMKHCINCSAHSDAMLLSDATAMQLGKTCLVHLRKTCCDW